MYICRGGDYSCLVLAPVRAASGRRRGGLPANIYIYIYIYIYTCIYLSISIYIHIYIYYSKFVEENVCMQ